MSVKSIDGDISKAFIKDSVPKFRIKLESSLSPMLTPPHTPTEELAHPILSTTENHFLCMPAGERTLMMESSQPSIRINSTVDFGYSHPLYQTSSSINQNTRDWVQAQSQFQFSPMSHDVPYGLSTNSSSSNHAMLMSHWIRNATIYTQQFGMYSSNFTRMSHIKPVVSIGTRPKKTVYLQIL